MRSDGREKPKGGRKGVMRRGGEEARRLLRGMSLLLSLESRLLLHVWVEGTPREHEVSGQH